MSRGPVRWRDPGHSRGLSTGGPGLRGPPLEAEFPVRSSPESVKRPVWSKLGRAFVIEVGPRTNAKRGVGFGKSKQPAVEREVRVRSGPLSRSGRVLVRSQLSLLELSRWDRVCVQAVCRHRAGQALESSREPIDCWSGATIRPITRGAASAALSCTRSYGTVPTCTSRWALSRTIRASARQSTSSSAQRHRGSRSRTTCLSRRSTRARARRVVRPRRTRARARADSEVAPGREAPSEIADRAVTQPTEE